MQTPASNVQVGLSEVLAALSYALDLTEGQPAGHTVRTCLIGMRMGREIGLTDGECSALYYALLLKDAGCSSNAARFASLFGTDDRAAKPAMKLVDWHKRTRLALRTAATAGRGQPFARRVAAFLRIARTPDVTRTLIAVRCDRGAAIAGDLGFPEETVEAIRSLDEHWCGLGYARGLSGAQIPLLSRIALLAQTVEAFHHHHGLDAAMAVARERTESWFDPALVRVVQGWGRDREWWSRLEGPSAEADVIASEPPDHVRAVDDGGLDAIARAFADIIDAKSPYTFQHSARVAGYARRAAALTGANAIETRRIYRAGLLHDIGKLGVSNRILDKPGKLDAAERAEIERHPALTQEILGRVGAFAGFARMAALHHEKLDGSGYPWRVTAPMLEDSARILAVADIYDALTSERPYRAPLTPAEALVLMTRDRETKLCGRALDALTAAVSADPNPFAS